MAVDTARVRQYLKSFDLKRVFIEELGWDHHRAQPLEIDIDGWAYRLDSVAQKRGMVAFVCQSDSDGHIPNYATRRKIDRRVGEYAHEHIIIFVDADKTTQIWQWVKRDYGKPVACREHTYNTSQPGDALIQKLDKLTFDLSEEEDLTITDVAKRACQAFDVERVTKRFYERFKAEHAAFLGFINGIPLKSDREWYASLMLNRLMFIYFIQKKGFLDGDVDYLRNRLRMMQMRRGKDEFLSFYRHFLLRLFHEGLGQRQESRSPDLDAVLGKVPFLNGGIFDVHELECGNPNIEIPDEAFEGLFDFFDSYQWHLDDRPLRADNEINPDVLGYIFEKYINQKELGAYYTKEDITEYIAKNTVIPFLFDRAEKNCAIAFRQDSAVWRLVRDDPDRYIYEAVRKGVDIPLPSEIAAGVEDVSERKQWNQPADAELALPTETWREHVERRMRCLELRARLAAGEIRCINDLITYNLDIRQFAQDVIETCEGPELLRAFYNAIQKVTILDPTCGSGAFLFAALNILEPLYEACLDRMQSFVDDLDETSKSRHPEKFSDFESTLQHVREHPSRRYFILRSIIVNNLYGVDIMEEAVEICKLRMFLKLVAHVDGLKDIEPLPDIDFNIRAGNTLVGYGSLDEVKKTLEGTLGFSKDDVYRIEKHAENADRAFQQFRAMQTNGDRAVKEALTAKVGLREHLKVLNSELDSYLAREYGAGSGDTAPVGRWREKHQPFHWLVEFYGIIRNGGFNVIIGNPPYVEYSKVKGKYHVRGYKTVGCGNLYAFMVERALNLLCDSGRIGMIVPSSAFSTTRMKPVVSELGRSYVWYSFYDFRPSKLFDGVNLRLAIFLANPTSNAPCYWSTTYNRWHADERSNLFTARIHYQPSILHRGIPLKIGHPIEHCIYKKTRCDYSIANIENGSSETVYYHNAILYWIRATDFAPSHRGYLSSHVKTLRFGDKNACHVACCLINSSLFYWWWVKMSNCRDLSVDDIRSLTFPKSLLGDPATLSRLHRALMKDLWANSRLKTRVQRQTGEVRYREFNPVLSKHLIDQIDRVLAQHYRLTDEELDFIISYDIKYRMGQNEDGDDE